MRFTLAALVFLAAAPGIARAQDDPACAKFEEPLAYNACLASHGPKANNIATAPGPAGARHAEPDEEAPIAPAKRAWRPAPVARRHGRIHMEFRVR